MTKKNLLVIAGVLVLTLAFAAMASAYGNRGFSQAFDGLTPEKQQVVRDIFEKHSDKLSALKNDAWAKQLELQALTDSGKATKADIKELVGEISELRVTYQKEREVMFDAVEAETGIQIPSGIGGGMGGGCPGGDQGKRRSKGDCPGGGGGCNRF